MSTPAPPAPGDRRPIKSRSIPLFISLANALAKSGLSANAISLIGMLLGIAAGILLYTTGTPYFPPSSARWLFLAAAASIQLRLLCNMLDGMVALASNTSSPLGELFNEIPDRISDTATLVGAGYALHSAPTLGWLAAALALFVTYIRALGKGAGVLGLFQGPMAKSHRMATLTCSCLLLAILPTNAWPLWHISLCSYCGVGLTALTLALISAGTFLTALRRTAILVKSLKQKSPSTPAPPPSEGTRTP